MLLFSHSIMSDCLQLHELQQARLPCPVSPRVCSNSCPLSWWCHPSISSSVASFSSCPQSFPASGSFPMSWFFTSSGQSIGALLLSSVLPMNIQGWFPCCPRDFQESSPAPRSESINFSRLSLLYGPTLTSIHDYWKTIALTIWTFVGKVVSAF